MKSRVVARRYAEAFFKAVEGPDREAIVEDCMAFAEAVKGKSPLGEALRHPVVKAAQKEKIIRMALEKATSPLLIDFILLLLERYRFQFFDLIAEEILRLYHKSKSIVRVSVKSAVPLTGEETNRMKPCLERLVKGTVILATTVDPSIKGGLIVGFDDKILDGSVKTKLRHLQEKMMARNSELLQSLGKAPVELV